MLKQIAQLIGNTERTIFAWKKENRPIIDLLQKYFTKEDLEEFLETGSVLKMETLNHYEETLNAEFNIFYRTKLGQDSQTKQLRFFWDFINRFKNDIININLRGCKSAISDLLLKYHLVVLELTASEDEVSPRNLRTLEFSEFITTMQSISEDLTYFIINNLKYNFKTHINYLVHYNLYSYATEILACSTINYYDNKLPYLREMRAHLFLNSFSKEHSLSIYYKEFYYVLEDYLLDYKNKKEEIYKVIKSANDRLVL